jgi:hypothetical protein
MWVVVVVFRLAGAALLIWAANYLEAQTTSEGYRRPTAESCLRFSDHNLSLQRFIVNFCRRTVYVSVIEFHAATPTKHCAVYGLLGRRYGKQYGPGEIYLRNSLQASFKVERALENCKYSGYEMSGEGFGTFMRIVKEKGK